MAQTALASPPSPIVRIPPPLLFAVTFALGWLLQRWLIGARYAGTSARAMSVAGIVLIVVGIGLALSAFALFALERTTIVPHSRAAAALVTRGPYRWTRNPMYVSLSAIYLGVSLDAGLLGPVLLLPLPLVLVGAFVIPFEEQTLDGVFGADYAAYRQRVRRWL